jgi:serine/threonine-protein kinase RsbW
VNLAGGSRDAQETPGIGHIVDVDSLAAIRSIISKAGRSAGLSEDATTDLVLAVNELATNVVRHGGGTGLMWVWSANGCVFCRVTDSGPGMTVPRIEPPPPGSVTGRGFWMIQRMTDKMDVQTGPHGTTVTIAITQR